VNGFTELLLMISIIAGHAITMLIGMIFIGLGQWKRQLTKKV
jgi:hypothetical protein